MIPVTVWVPKDPAADFKQAAERVCRRQSTRSPNRSRRSTTSITTTDPTAPLQEKPQPNTSLSAELNKPRQLLCPEPGHAVDGAPV